MAAMLLASQPLAGATPGETARPLRVGILMAMHRDVDFPVWGATVARLRKAFPDRTVIAQPLDIDGIKAAARSGEYEFLILNPSMYAELEGEGLRRLVGLKTPWASSPEHSIASAIFVRSDRKDLNRLEDLRGKRIEAAHPEAFGGWMVALREMKRRGIDPQRDLAEVSFGKDTARTPIYAVLSGRADAGVVRACVIEQMEAAGVLEDGALKVLGPLPREGLNCERSTPTYPDWLIAATESTPSGLAHDLSSALLTMPPTAAGFQWSVAGDYRGVDELFRELGRGKYANQGRPDLGSLARNHSEWAFALLLFVLGGVLHVTLAQRLVNQRTAQLKRALAERDQIEQHRRAQQERIDHLARLGVLGEISSMVAHEINQPLATIGGYARGLERRLGSGADPRLLAPIAGDIAAQSERAGEIVANIRSFARKRPPEMREFDLRDSLRDALALFTGAGRASISHPPLPVAWVRGDRVQLQQVIVNLVKNALDAQRPDGTEVQVRITIARHAASWRLAVEDNGAAIDPEEFERFFEPFFTTKTEGLGLGLAICRGIIEAHGGRMFVDRRCDAPGLVVGFDLPTLDHEH